MKRLSSRAAIAALLLGGTAMISQPAAADSHRMYRVTITNLTAGQVVTPPLVVAHEKRFRLFETGVEASDELSTLAETGNPVPLADALMDGDGVIDVVHGAPEVILPGESLTLEIATTRRGRYLSFAAMLALTNDAFAAVRGLELPFGIGKTVSTRAVAYDAGSEANLETAATVPGLGGEDRATEGAEGFIHIHRGVHGVGDLLPEEHDWRNPVVEVTAERVM